MTTKEWTKDGTDWSQWAEIKVHPLSGAERASQPEWSLQPTLSNALYDEGGEKKQLSCIWLRGTQPAAGYKTQNMCAASVTHAIDCCAGCNPAAPNHPRWTTEVIRRDMWRVRKKGTHKRSAMALIQPACACLIRCESSLMNERPHAATRWNSWILSARDLTSPGVIRSGSSTPRLSKWITRVFCRPLITVNHVPKWWSG